MIYVLQMNTDKRMCLSLQYRNELWVVRHSDKFDRLDCELCMIREREQIFAVEEILKKEYTEFYREIKSFLDQIRNDGQAASLKHKMLQSYVRQLEYYDEGRFFEWFPEEKKAAFGSLVSSGDVPYVRAGKKIGRNDPCPCGSGKKYKQCCMRKDM